MAVVRAGDIELSYERSGAGPPLLLIMGMSGTALHWGEPFLELLRRDFELIAYDHRGVGASTRLEGEVTIAQMAEDASALLSGRLTTKLNDEGGNFLRLTLTGTDAVETSTTMNVLEDQFVTVAADLKKQKLRLLTGLLSEQVT